MPHTDQAPAPARAPARAGDAPLEAQRARLVELLRAKRTLVVVGPGGVGKTTTSAAFALHAARLGLNVLVLTVDPARRLATSLGLEGLGTEETRIDPALFREEGVSLGRGGQLHAMMLDVKSTFDALIERHAPSPAVRDRIFANPFYEQASTVLAGSQEYMATEKLYELRSSRDYDLIILDTPPTSNALDFLSASQRLEDFLDSGAVRLMIQSARTAGRMGLGFLRLNNLILKGLNRFIGASTFLNLLDFIESFHDMYAGFKDRAHRVREILRAQDAGFVIVSSTDGAALDEGLYFHDELRAHGMPFGAFLVNRVRTRRFDYGPVDELRAHLRERAVQAPSLKLYDPARTALLAERASRACQDYDRLVRADARRLDDLRETLGEDAAAVCPVPLFDQDIHSLRGLADFGEAVFGPVG